MEVIGVAVIAVAIIIGYWASTHQRKPWTVAQSYRQHTWDMDYVRKKVLPPVQPPMHVPAPVPTPIRVAAAKPAPICNLMCRERELAQERYWKAVRSPLGPDQRKVQKLPSLYHPTPMATPGVPLVMGAWR